MWCCLLLAALLCEGCSASGEQPKARAPTPVENGRIVRDTYAVEITAVGKYPDLTFRFVDCSDGQPSSWITSINVVRENRLVCDVEATRNPVPPVWHYGELGGEYQGKCEALAPGTYGIEVRGGEMGRAEFEVANDGSVSVAGLRCDTARERRTPPP